MNVFLKRAKAKCKAWGLRIPTNYVILLSEGRSYASSKTRRADEGSRPPCQIQDPRTLARCTWANGWPSSQSYPKWPSPRPCCPLGWGGHRLPWSSAAMIPDLNERISVRRIALFFWKYTSLTSLWASIIPSRSTLGTPRYFATSRAAWRCSLKLWHETLPLTPVALNVAAVGVKMIMFCFWIPWLFVQAHDEILKHSSIWRISFKTLGSRACYLYLIVIKECMRSTDWTQQQQMSLTVFAVRDGQDHIFQKFTIHLFLDLKLWFVQIWS